MRGHVVTGLRPRPLFREARSLIWGLVQGALFWKYVALFIAVISVALVTDSLINIWLTYQEHRNNLIRFQAAQADAAAARITQFINEIEDQLGWMTHLSWANPAIEQRRTRWTTRVQGFDIASSRLSSLVQAPGAVTD